MYIIIWSVLTIIVYFIFGAFYPILRCYLITRKYAPYVQNLSFPLLGSVYRSRKSRKIYKDSLEYLRILFRQNPQTQMFISNISVSQIIWDITCPEIAKEFLQNAKENYYPSISRQIYAIGYDISDGLLWKRQRKSLSPVFHFGELEKRIEPIKEVVQEYLPSLMEKAKKGEVLSIIQEMQNITGEVIVRSFFGKQLVENNADGLSFQKHISTIFSDSIKCALQKSFILKSLLFGRNFAQNYLMTDFHKKTIEKVNSIRKTIFQCIDDRIKDFKQEKDKLFLLDILISQYLNQNKEKEDNFVEITKEELLHQFMSFYFAGMETTANLSSKLIYMLGMYPQVYKNLQSEINSTFTNTSQVTLDKLKSMKYLNAYTKEVLRFNLTISGVISRTVKKETLLGDRYLIQPGDRVGVSIGTIMSAEKNFPDAAKFDVDRWIDEEKIKKNNHMAFIPFSSGPRNCIGQHMATIEAQIILVNILMNFEVETVNQDSIVLDSMVAYGPMDDKIVKLTIKK